METEGMCFKVNLSEKNYRSFNFWYLYGRTVGKLGLILSLLVLVEIPVLIYLYYLEPASNLLFILGAASLFILFYMILLPSLTYVQSKSVFKSDKFLQEEQTYIVNEAGIDVITQSSSVKIKWDEIYKAVETRKHYFIFVARNKAMIIPKDAFEDASEEVKFRDLMKGSTPKDRLKYIKNKK